MTEALKVIVELLKRPGTIPLAVGVVLAGAGQFLQNSDDPLIKSYSDDVFIAGVAIAIGGLLWLGLRRRPASRLAKPEALKEVSKAFVGRDDDQEKLTQLVQNHPLVFLVGESGAGKSTLLRRGVLPELEKDSAFLPAYLSYWGADWVNDVRESLTRELRKVSGDPELTTDVLIPWLATQRPKGRVPVLLFDQFDDYITRHRSRFLPDEKGGRVLTVTELRERNALWDELSRLVEEGSIHCLFAVRQDMHWGLACARFRPEEVYLLPRLGRGVARGLVHDLTSDNVIDNPEGGWEALRDRLCGDLERDGLLPIRMRLAFQSLPALNKLTLRAYDGVRGLVGLEATHIGDQTEEAARLSGVPPAALRRILVEMVNRESQKTVVRTEEQLLVALDEWRGHHRPAEGQTASQGEPAVQTPSRERRESSPLRVSLEFLAKQEITRQRLEAESTDAVWQLDHDYLANGVIELDRRENRWRYLLEDKARRFRDAGKLVSKFRALLSPWEQINIALQALLRGLRYAPHQRLATYSLVRLALNPWLPLIVSVGIALNWWWTLEQARDLYIWIGESGPIARAEAQALWDMSQSSPAVRRAVVSTALKPGDAVRFTRSFGTRTSLFGRRPVFQHSGSRSDSVLHAAVGMDQKVRQTIFNEQIAGQCSKPGIEDVDQRRACVLAAIHLDGQPVVTARLIVAAMEKTDSDLSALGSGLGSLAERLTREQVAESARRLLTAMEKTTDPYRLSSLASGLGSLGERLTGEQATEGARRLLAAMVETTHRFQLNSLASGLGSLGERLTREQAAEFARLLLTAMEETTHPYQLSSLARGLGSLGDRLTGEQAAEGTRRLLAAMEETTNPFGLSSLASGLGSLGERLTGEQAAKVARLLLAAMEKTTAPGQLSSLASGLGSLDEKLTGEQAAEVARLLLAAMGNTTDPYELSSLASGLRSLDEKLTGEQAAEGARGLVAAMEKTIDLEQLSSLANGLRLLAERLPGQQAAEVAWRLLAAMEKTTNPDQLGYLAGGLRSLGERLTAEQAAEVARRLLAAMGNTNSTSFSQLSSLASGLRSLGERPPGKQAAEVARRLLAAMEKTTEPKQLSFLAEGLGALGERLPGEQAAEVARRLVAAMEKTTNPDSLSSLATGLGSLGERLPGEQAAELARRLLAVMEKTTKPDSLGFLVEGLMSLGERLSGEQAAEVARRLLAVMEKTTNRDSLGFLAEGLGSLGERLPESDATVAMEEASPWIRRVSEPPCGAFTSLLRTGNVRFVVEEILKWPTCSPNDRDRLLRGIAKTTGEGKEFGCPDPADQKQCKLNWWAFVDWAADRGYDVLRPPTPPDQILN